MLRSDEDNIVDDELGDPQSNDWDQRSDQTEKQPQRNDQRPRLPHNFQDRRHVAQGGEPFSPPAPESFLSGHFFVRKSEHLKDAKKPFGVFVGR